MMDIKIFTHGKTCVKRVLGGEGRGTGKGALTKLRGREGGAGAERLILTYVGHLQLISILKIGADCCQLCQYKLTKPNLT